MKADTEGVPPHVVASIETLIQGVIAQNLVDPDTTRRSDEWKAGYAYGYREVMWMWALEKARASHESR